MRDIEKRGGKKEKTLEFSWLGLTTYIHRIRAQKATLISHTPFNIVHCLNLMILSSKQSLDLLTNLKIVFRQSMS